MQPTTTCPRSNRVGRYPFITPRPSSRVSPNSSLSSKEQHLQHNQHQESGHKISETLSWHLLDDALLRPRCKAFIDSAPQTKLLQCHAAQITPSEDDSRSRTGPGEAKRLTIRKRICLSGNHRKRDLCQTRHTRNLDPTGLIEEPRTPINFDE